MKASSESGLWAIRIFIVILQVLLCSTCNSESRIPNHYVHPHLLHIIVGTLHNVWLRDALDDDGQPECNQDDRGGETEVNTGSGEGVRRALERPVLHDCKRLSDRQGTFARDAREN